MSNSKTSYTSIGQAISETAAKYKSNESIEHCLSWINEDQDRLTEWAYETGFFFGIDDDFVFLTSEEELFLTGDDELLEYFDAEQLDLKEDSEILAFVLKRTETLFSDDPTAAHFYNRDGVYLTAFCESWGQAGLHFSRFNVYSSKEEYISYLKEQGYMLFGICGSHSDDELITMFRKNVTDKYSLG